METGWRESERSARPLRRIQTPKQAFGIISRAYLLGYYNNTVYETVAGDCDPEYIDSDGTNVGITILNDEIGQVHSSPMSTRILPSEGSCYSNDRVKGRARMKRLVDIKGYQMITYWKK